LHLRSEIRTKEIAMNMRIGGADPARWGSHIAAVHLSADCRRLADDVANGADDRVIASDKAAVVESSQDVSARRSGRLDVMA
jgi:hypothetical protein